MYQKFSPGSFRPSQISVPWSLSGATARGSAKGKNEVIFRPVLTHFSHTTNTLNAHTTIALPHPRAMGNLLSGDVLRCQSLTKFRSAISVPWSLHGAIARGTVYGKERNGKE